ncbi:unnamed protein product [Coccothraustes coccothraustes]
MVPPAGRRQAVALRAGIARVSSRGLAAAPGAPRAAAVEAELRSIPAEGRGDKAGPGGLPAVGQPRGWRGQQDFVGLYHKRRKAKASFAVGEASGTGSHVPRRSIPGSPGKRSAPAFPERAGVPDGRSLTPSCLFCHKPRGYGNTTHLSPSPQ